MTGAIEKPFKDPHLKSNKYLFRHFNLVPGFVWTFRLFKSACGCSLIIPLLILYKEGRRWKRPHTPLTKREIACGSNNFSTRLME